MSHSVNIKKELDDVAMYAQIFGYSVKLYEFTVLLYAKPLSKLPQTNGFVIVSQ